jgi:hypothetical protein
LSPKIGWDIITLYIYNESGGQIASTSYMGCKNTIGLANGTYNLTIKGKQTSSSSWATAIDKKYYEEGKICTVLVNVNANTFNYTCFVPPCPGDVDGNKWVNIIDLAIIGSCFGKVAEGNCEKADLSKDGFVNIFDLAIVAKNFGRKC